MIQTILLATDGSGCAERAANFAASLGKSYHARVIVVHAYTPLPGEQDPPGSRRALYETRDQARSLVGATARRLQDMGVSQVETEVMEGPAANVVLGVAETYTPDILVLGARGTSTWQGNLLGSVSMAVTQRAECPVLVVK